MKHYEHVRRLHIEYIEFSLLCSHHCGANDTWKKNVIQEYCYIIRWTKYIIKYYLMKYTVIFMCKYSNEMMRSIKALELKYFTIRLECWEKMRYNR